MRQPPRPPQPETPCPAPECSPAPTSPHTTHTFPRLGIVSFTPALTLTPSIKPCSLQPMRQALICRSRLQGLLVLQQCHAGVLLSCCLFHVAPMGFHTVLVHRSSSAAHVSTCTLIKEGRLLGLRTYLARACQPPAWEYLYKLGPMSRSECPHFGKQAGAPAPAPSAACQLHTPQT